MSLIERVGAGVLRVHQAIYEGTRGAVGHRMIGVPTLLMTSLGRKTGKARTAALVYAMDDGAYVVVASNGGADTPPGWIHNIKANPSVDVQIGRRHLDAMADVIEPSSADYDRLWKLVNQRNRGRYDAYQRKTTRRILLARLTPS